MVSTMDDDYDSRAMLVRKKALKVQERLGMRIGVSYSTSRVKAIRTTDDALTALTELYKVGLRAFVLPKELFEKIKDTTDLYKEHYGDLLKIINLAQKYNIELSLHHNDLPDDQVALDSVLKLYCNIANIMDCRTFIIHPNFYKMVPHDQSVKLIVYKMNELANSMNIKIKIGIETTGRVDQVGSLEDVLDIAKRTTSTEPIVNFAHIHARGVGALRSETDFKNVLDKIRKEVGPNWVSNAFMVFAGVTYGPSGVKDHVTFTKSDLKLQHLIKSLTSSGVKGTLIFSDPKKELAVLDILKELADMVR